MRALVNTGNASSRAVTAALGPSRPNASARSTTSLIWRGHGELDPQDIHQSPGSVVDPILDAATAESDFDLRELRKKPMSIYVGSILMICIACGRCSTSFSSRP